MMITILDIRKLLIGFSFIFFLGSYTLQAQNIKPVEPKSYTAPDGKLYWNKSMPVYIRLANSPTDTGQLVKTQTADDVNPYFFDAEGANQIRTKWATDSVGNRIEPPTELTWEVFADGQAPKSIPDFQTKTEYLNNNTRYYGSDLSIDILSVDKLSGTDKTYYSINGLPYAEFDAALQINREGEYTLSYYSVDKVGNVEGAQSIDFKLDMTPPQTEYAIAGGTFRDIYSVDTRIILSATDFGSGVSEILYSFDGKEPQTYNGTHINISGLENGEHTISYFALDNVKNEEKAKSFNFYLDKMAPLLSSTIIGDQFVKDGKIYFSGRSKLKLTAADDKSGLEEIQFSLDGTTYTVYDEPFYLPGVSGLHTVKYFAIDSMQNKTETKRLIDARYENMIFNEEQLYADIVPPSIDYDFLGNSFNTRDTLFLSGNTKIRFKGQDSESGINRIMYYVDGKPTAETYSLPFSLEYIDGGPHTLRVVCFDNVNNQSAKEFDFVLDNTPPELHYFFSVSAYAKEDGIDVYPPYVNVYLAASDITTGAKSVTYSLNGAAEKTYTGSISGFAKGKVNILKIFTTDNLGNERTMETRFYIR